VEKLNIITQNKGLSNNTALSLYEDVDKKLMGRIRQWHQLHQSTISHSKFFVTIQGTVYTSKLYNGNLYVGTNQGLYKNTKLLMNLSL
jgi:hypothetical protein